MCNKLKSKINTPWETSCLVCCVLIWIGLIWEVIIRRSFLFTSTALHSGSDGLQFVFLAVLCSYDFTQNENEFVSNCRGQQGFED